MAKVRDTIKRQNLICEGDTVVIAVSGGADSVALFHVLFKLASEISFVPIIAHINHQLRGKESDDDETFVCALAKEYKIRYICKRVKAREYAQRTGMSLEAAARELRYQALLSIARKYKAMVIAVAHHTQDLVETMLMHFLRGSGKTGICGFAIQNWMGEVRVIRPFFDVRREEILTFLKEHKISYRIDSTNADMRFFRNRVRLELIPLLSEGYNPNLIETLHRTSAILEAEDQYLENIAGEIFQSLEEGAEVPLQIIPVNFLNNLPVAILRRLVRQWVARLVASMNPPTMAEIEAVISLCRSKVPGKYNIVQNQAIFYRDYSFLVGGAFAHRPARGRISPIRIERHIADTLLKYHSDMGYAIIPVPRDFSIKIATDKLKGVTTTKQYKKEGIQVIIQHRKPKTCDANACTICLPLPERPEIIEIRTPRPGDIVERPGGAKALNRYFIDEKISAILRKHVLLLGCNKKVIWIPGSGQFKEPYSYTKKSQRVYIIIQKETRKHHGARFY